jgi:hypothetical protein
MRARRLTLVIGALIGATGCGRASPSDPLPSVDACLVVDADDARAHITVGVADALDPRALNTTAAGRFGFAQLYQTLVEVECTGSVVPALANEWSSDDGRTWRFGIVRGATFADGTPVTARSIMEAWSAAGVQSLAAVTAVGEHDLRVTLRDPADERIFAMPALAAARTRSGTLPAGTGPYTADSVAPTGVLRLLRRAPDPGVPDTIDVRTVNGDPRTALDAGVDALVTADAATLAYARARSDYTVTPLPWSRTYVLATARAAGGAAPLPTGEVAAPTIEDLTSLARDAVGGDARPARPPYWWQECTASVSSVVGAGTGEIIYRRDDSVARAIAERITALAWPRERTPAWLRDILREYDAAPRARAVADGELAEAARSGSALAIVTALPRTAYAGCTGVGLDPRDRIASAPLIASHVTPLLDTRAYLIHHPGTGRVRVDGSGTIRFGAR